MDVVIAVEHRFARTPDGATWTSTVLARPHWSRYLRVFGRVTVLARVRDVPAREPRWQRVDDGLVDVHPLPYYVGPREYLARSVSFRREVRAALAARAAEAVILRAPGMAASVAARALGSAGRPYGVEVIGDPFEVFAPGAVQHPLRPFLRWWSKRELRALCAGAASALYVTSSALQRRYPPSRKERIAAFAASDVELEPDAFAPASRPPRRGAAPLRVVTVGTLEQLYKSPDVIIAAVARCAARGLGVELVIVGDGRYRGGLQDLARSLNVAGQVSFRGQVPSGDAVRRELDAADLFVLPSRTEGMPRALIEAMARGLPCLATPVGGIPELLPASDLVRPDAEELAARFAELAAAPELLAEMSRRNLARARDFDDRNLQPIREAFQRHLVARTSA